MTSRLFQLSIFIFLTMLLAARCSNESNNTEPIEYNPELIQRIRAAASVIPGSLPVSIGYLKFGESVRKWSDVIEDGSDDACKMARTAFQIDYADGWVMVDAGMDRTVHKFFEKDTPQPFDEAKADIVRQAVEGAKLVVITNEQGDHVAGVIRTANTGSVPRKTILTRAQVSSLVNDPQMPEIKLDANASKQYIITDFQTILPVAPGIVLIKAPGHTKGELMVYTRLQNGREFLFTGDVSWSYKGIAEKKQKPKKETKEIGEDTDLILKQLAWLNDLMNKEKMTILVSHDDIMLPQFAAQGLISDTLKTGK